MAYTDTIDKVIGITSTGAGIETEIAVPVSDVSFDKTSGAELIHASGKRKAWGSRPGPAEISGSFEFILTPHTVKLIDMAIDGDVFTINEGLGGEKSADAEVTSWSVSGEYAEVLTVSMDFTCKTTDSGTEITASPNLDTPYIGINVSTTVEGGTVDFESFEISGDNGLTAVHGMTGATRTPSHLTKGYSNYTASFNFLEAPAVNPLADTLVKDDSLTIQVQQADGTNPSITFTLTKVSATDKNKSAGSEDIWKWDVSYIVEDVSYATAAA